MARARLISQAATAEADALVASPLPRCDKLPGTRCSATPPGGCRAGSQSLAAPCHLHCLGTGQGTEQCVGTQAPSCPGSLGEQQAGRMGAPAWVSQALQPHLTPPRPSRSPNPPPAASPTPCQALQLPGPDLGPGALLCLGDTQGTQRAGLPRAVLSCAPAPFPPGTLALLLTATLALRLPLPRRSSRRSPRHDFSPRRPDSPKTSRPPAHTCSASRSWLCIC